MAKLTINTESVTVPWFVGLIMFHETIDAYETMGWKKVHRVGDNDDSEGVDNRFKVLTSAGEFVTIRVERA